MELWKLFGFSNYLQNKQIKDQLAADSNKPKCPHCGGPTEQSFARCKNCGQKIVWAGNVATKPKVLSEIKRKNKGLAQSVPTSGQQKNKTNRSSYITDSTDKSFEGDAIRASQDRLVLVEFWASWCQSCQKLSPILEDVAQRYGGDILLVKVNTDIATKTTTKFNVSGIPMTFAIHDEEVVDHFEGVLDEDDISRWIERLT